MYFSTPSAKTCSFSEGDLAEEIYSAAVVSMALSENVFQGLTVMVTFAKINFQKERQKADTADFKVNAP